MKQMKLVFIFPENIVEEPVTYHLIADYGVRVNILRASIDPGKQGRMVVELVGEEIQISHVWRSAFIRPCRWRNSWHNDSTFVTAPQPLKTAAVTPKLKRTVKAFQKKPTITFYYLRLISQNLMRSCENFRF